MSDQDIITGAAICHATGDPITDLQAKVIANAWHDGMFSALYSFTSTGAIRETEMYMGSLVYGTADEINACMQAVRDHPSVYNGTEMPPLDGLLAYVRKHGPRGPQDGWRNLTW